MIWPQKGMGIKLTRIPPFLLKRVKIYHFRCYVCVYRRGFSIHTQSSDLILILSAVGYRDGVLDEYITLTNMKLSKLSGMQQNFLWIHKYQEILLRFIYDDNL